MMWEERLKYVSKWEYSKNKELIDSSGLYHTEKFIE